MEAINEIVSKNTSSQLSRLNLREKVEIGGFVVYFAVAISGGMTAVADNSENGHFTSSALLVNNQAFEQSLSGNVNLKVEPLAPTRDLYNYSMMEASFNSNFKGDKGEAEKYRGTFDFLASALKSLYIENVYVDVSKISHNIDFCMNLGKKILIMVGLNAFDREDDDVTYSVYHDGELMAMNIASLGFFMEMTNGMQNELNQEECSIYTPIR